MMQVIPFSPSDRKRDVHISQVSSECLRMINFISYFLRCNQSYPAFFLDIYFCTAVHLHDYDAHSHLKACVFTLRSHISTLY